jgi:DNA modification methylase
MRPALASATSGPLPSPYYSDAVCTIYHGDCRKLLPGLTADVVITDPPYGSGRIRGSKIRGFVDELATAIEGMNLAPGLLAAAFMSPSRVLAFGTELTWTFERLLWMHKTADLATPWRSWCTNSEAVMVLSRPGAIWPPPQSYRTDTYSVGPAGKQGHPAAKPLTVVRDLVTRLSSAEGLILDPFMGSGTTLRAAKDLGRKAIGIEIEERYCEIAAKRLGQEVLAL